MPKPEPEDLEAFVRGRDAAELADVLIELSHRHEAVAERLHRMRLRDRPRDLAKSFRRTLSGWRRSRRFRTGRDALAFGRELEAWLDQVATEVLPADATAALSLYEAFLSAEPDWFAQADDSDGAIGDAVRAACRQWLAAAARCPAPRDGWAKQVVALYEGADYGARDELLRHADLLLDEAAMRGLAADFDARLAQVVATSRSVDRFPADVFRWSAALSLLAKPLRDPSVHINAVLRYSPDPNALQRRAFVRACLDYGSPAAALEWLAGHWGSHEDDREYLTAEVYESLGRFDESLMIRERVFERTLSEDDLASWLLHLPESRRAAATERAGALARTHDDAVTAAELLIHLGDASAAEARLVDSADRLDGGNYLALVPMAKAMRAADCARGETVVYRALLRSILEHGRSPAYRHAARYFLRLGEISGEGAGLEPLAAHADFETTLRLQHRRKTGFWGCVERAREDRRQSAAKPP